nr:uncharacterized protein LOC103423969 isoform X1 [Malus domestica]
MENVAHIDKLQPYVKAAKIKVQICRIWKSTIPGTVQKYIALHCILLDEMQYVIETCTTEMDYEIVASKIEAGNCYEIMGFRTNRMRGQYKVVPHDTQVVFTRKTIFKKLSSVFPPIHRHRFFLQDYNTLYLRLNMVDILTDIPELNAYKSVFSINTEAVKLLAPSSRQVNEAQILQTARRVTVDELAFFYPDLYKDETFLCRASIKRFDTRYNWWYSTCPNCVKQMQKDPYVRVGKKIIVK